MSYGRCEICKEYAFINSHKCPPIFLFKHEYWGDEWEEIRAYNHDDAAEKFAKIYNEDGDYTLMNDHTTVLISDGKIEKKYDVGAEASIEYWIKEQ